jgi:hypothetical protein
MLIYSTCPSCNQLLIVTYMGQESHPSCPQTEAEKLAREFVDAIQRDDFAEADRLEKLIDQPAVPALGSSAVWYAEQGWKVFPLAPNSKQPLVAKRDGGNGLYDATTDLGQVRQWWKQYPSANIGLPTGEKFDVIDIDGPEGAKSFSKLSEDKVPDVHGKVSTPRGLHLFVLPTGDGNRAGVLPGIDYRGKGGYVCAPPSQLDYKRWTWLVKPSPEILVSSGV